MDGEQHTLISDNTSLHGRFGSSRRAAFELGVPKVPASRHRRSSSYYICKRCARSWRATALIKPPAGAMQYTVVDGSGGAQPAAAEAAVRKGPWTMEEDLVLVNYVAANGEVAWNNLARAAGTWLNRTGKSCRLRWLNYLRPDVRRGSITPEEHLLIVELQARWGNRWSKIARHLPGRTDNEIKNFWRTKIQKKHRDNNSAGTSTTGSTEPAAGYQSTAAPAVAESQSSSVTPDYDFVAARQPGSSMRSQLDHHQQLQGYAVHGGGGGGGGGAACAVGGMNGAVSPEFLQAAAATAASGDNFWALEDFWPTVPSLHGDC